MIFKNDKGFFQIREFLFPGLLHGFSPKSFGNLSYRYGDKIEVDKNRLKFSQVVGINSKKVVKAGIIHGTKTAVVSSSDTSDLNADSYSEMTDALITNSQNVALWILTGDCTPFLFFDPKKRVIGLAHSGWRGTVGKLPIIVFAKMITKFGCKPGNILIGVGPSIEKCHYIKTKPIFPESFPEWDKYLTPAGDDKQSIDLNGFSINQLEEIGARKSNIFYSKYCVADHNDEFFSQQMEKLGKDKPGRFATVIQLT